MMNRKLRYGIKVLSDTPGAGPEVERGKIYHIRLKMWLNKGDPVRWTQPWGILQNARLDDDGETLFTDVRIDREFLINGLFYGVEGMRLGGTRKLRIPPEFGYGEIGVPEVIPENAVLFAEISILEERNKAKD